MAPNILFVALISRDARPLYMQMFNSTTKSETQNKEEDQKEPQAVDGEPENVTENVSSSGPADTSNRQVSDIDAGIFLKYNFLAHMALDVFAAPLALSSQENQVDGVALLFIQDDVVVYGLETNNGLKVVVGMSDKQEPAVLLQLFNRIHRCYIRTVCNPFSEVLNARDCENMLQTEKFDLRIREAIYLVPFKSKLDE